MPMAPHGTHTHSMDDTLEQQKITTDAAKCTSLVKEAKCTQTLWHSFPQNTKVLFQTPADIVIQTTQDIMQVLNNPPLVKQYQPIGQS